MEQSWIYILKAFCFCLTKAMKGKVIKMGTATVMTVLLVILQNLNTAAADVSTHAGNFNQA